jgi:hypothetical protein
MRPYCVVYKTWSESLTLGSSVQTVFSDAAAPNRRSKLARPRVVHVHPAAACMSLSVQLDHAYHSSSSPSVNASTPAATYDSSLNSSYRCGSLLCACRRLRAVRRRGGVFAPRYLVSLTSINQRRRKRRDGVGGCSRASGQLVLYRRMEEQKNASVPSRRLPSQSYSTCSRVMVPKATRRRSPSFVTTTCSVQQKPE